MDTDVFILVIDYQNGETYSDGDEASVHATREAAVRRIQATAIRLGLASGLADGDPATDDQGQYFVAYSGFLSWNITPATIEN